jgi:hypothetical protein
MGSELISRPSFTVGSCKRRRWTLAWALQKAEHRSIRWNKGLSQALFENSVYTVHTDLMTARSLDVWLHTGLNVNTCSMQRRDVCHIDRVMDCSGLVE